MSQWQASEQQGINSSLMGLLGQLCASAALPYWQGNFQVRWRILKCDWYKVDYDPHYLNFMQSKDWDAPQQP